MRAYLKIHPLPDEYQYMHFDRRFSDPEPEPIAEIKEPALLIKGKDTDSYYWQERREGLDHFMFGLVDKQGEEILPAEYRWLRMSEGWSGPRGYTAWKDGRWYFIELKIEVISSTPMSAY